MAARWTQYQLSELGLDSLLFAARVAAPVFSAADIVIRPLRTLRVFAAVRAIGGSPITVVRQIWFGRATRESLRIALQAGMSRAVLGRVTVTGNTTALERPCVYAIYHTPWGRAMAHWLRTRTRTALFATGRWEERARTAHLPCDPSGLRQLLRRLRSGGCAAITMDHFSGSADSCAVTLMGRTVQVSTGVARIAIAAGVPIVPVIPRFLNGRIELHLGDTIEAGMKSPAQVTSAMFESFNAELHRDAGGWEGAFSFLSGVPGISS